MFQILAAESPNRVSLIEDSKGESSDSEDDLPLSSALVPVRLHEPTQQRNSYSRIPEDSNSETEAKQSHVGEMIMKAIDIVDSTSTVSNPCLYFLCTDIALLGRLCFVLMKGYCMQHQPLKSIRRLINQAQL